MRRTVCGGLQPRRKEKLRRCGQLPHHKGKRDAWSIFGVIVQGCGDGENSDAEKWKSQGSPANRQRKSGRGIRLCREKEPRSAIAYQLLTNSLSSAY